MTKFGRERRMSAPGVREVRRAISEKNRPIPKAAGERMREGVRFRKDFGVRERIPQDDHILYSLRSALGDRAVQDIVGELRKRGAIEDEAGRIKSIDWSAMLKKVTREVERRSPEAMEKLHESRERFKESYGAMRSVIRELPEQEVAEKRMENTIIFFGESKDEEGEEEKELGSFDAKNILMRIGEALAGEEGQGLDETVFHETYHEISNYREAIIPQGGWRQKGVAVSRVRGRREDEVARFRWINEAVTEMLGRLHAFLANGKNREDIFKGMTSAEIFERAFYKSAYGPLGESLAYQDEIVTLGFLMERFNEGDRGAVMHELLEAFFNADIVDGEADAPDAWHEFSRRVQAKLGAGFLVRLDKIIEEKGVNAGAQMVRGAKENN